MATAREVVSNADSYNSILYGAIAGIVVAFAISVLTRAAKIGATIESAFEVASRMFPTIVVLILAWSLSGAMQDLMLAKVAETELREASFNPIWLPLLIFASSSIVSFATGTSWGTMGILCPATVSISAGLLGDMPGETGLPLFYASVGGVLAGAVFGDHCSPISDTTVLSSLASECKHEEHVWTQIPYAITVAIVSAVCGNVLCQKFNQPWWIGLLAGCAALLLVVFILGRRPQYADAADPAA
jgi:Na+/H+ antiporter NhaC